MSAPAVGLHEFSVVSNEPAAEGLMRVVLSAPALARELSAGQFVNVAVPGDASQVLRVPLSFSRADGEAGTVEIVYAVVGDGTRRLAAMAAGETSTAVGPCGNPWPLPAGARRACVVAAGVAFDAVVGAQTAGRLWGADVLEGLGAGRVVVTTDDGSAGRAGFTTAALADLLAEGGYDVVYTCGPEVMMAGVARLCREAGVACRVSMERMMGCGFGACNTCNVAMADGTYRSCCKDGPVFDAEEVAW